MGKSNRIRTKRAGEQVRSLNTKKKTGMPSWAMTLITLVLTVALVLSVVLLLVSANGVFGRMTTVIHSQNYKVNSNMMAYYFNTQYQGFVSDYSTYIENGYFSLDTSKELDDQKFGGSGEDGKTYYDSTFLGSFEGTWRDYFMNSTVDSVKTILLYCEEANARSIALDQADLDSIDSEIQSFVSMASMYGYPSVNSFLAEQYGKGVSEGDVRDCLEYSKLASKMMQIISDEIESAITDTDISSKYDANKLDYNTIDYTYYTFKVNYDDVAKEVLGSDYTDEELEASKDAVLAKYREKILAAKAELAKFESSGDAFAFKYNLYLKAATEAFDAYYGKQTVADVDKPADADFATIKNALIVDAVSEAIENSGTSTDAATIDGDSATAYDIHVTAAYGKILNSVKTEVLTKLADTKTTYVVEKATYSKDNEFSKWAFDDARVVGETKTIADGDGSAEGEIVNVKGYYSASIYMLNATQRKDTDKAKNVAYMVFESTQKAQTALGAFAQGEHTKDAFLAIGETNENLGSQAIENYTKGSFGNADFDKWLFDDKTLLGHYTTTPIKIDDKAYLIAYYYGDGEELWRLDVKNTVFNERADAELDRMENAYAVTTKDKALAKVKV